MMDAFTDGYRPASHLPMIEDRRPIVFLGLLPTFKLVLDRTTALSDVFERGKIISFRSLGKFIVILPL
jgi:hypothetical protein